MNDILGILIPMLMSGADVGDIGGAIGGAGNGSAGMDGLTAMLNEQRFNARNTRAGQLVQNQKTINQAAESLIDRIGVNPYSGLGQGISSMLGSMYHLAPDTVGSILGIPNGSQFFSTVSNGAAGINQASGFGAPDMFNPYSVISAHNRTMSMARQAYDLGIRPGGGYNIDYGHGLNMGEMSKVTQRLLSSGIPYREYASENGKVDFRTETGRSLDLSTGPDGKYVNQEDANKFSENLKKLGSKFNEATAMLSKVTGSVEEALNVMDRLAGGNFLGGTAEQATAVANRARKMATAIRVTSAMAGIKPQEMYANMQSLQQSMSAGMGLSPYVAQASGFNNLMQDMAYAGTVGYSSWAAMNQNASPQERQQALFAANGRAQSYATSNGASLAAAFADNAKLFTEAERKQFIESYRSGNPNEMASLIRQRIGSSMYTEYMTDPAMQIAARKRAAAENPELLRSIDQAGEEGNLAQAEQFGAKRILRKTLSDMDTEMASLTGSGGFSKNVDDRVKKSLQGMAVKQGLTEEAAGKMSMDDLRKFLKSRPGADAAEVDRSENVARIQAARDRLDELRMSDSDKVNTRKRLKDEIAANTDWSESKRNEMIRKIDEGQDIGTVYKEYASGVRGEAARGLRKRVFGGKLTDDELARTKTKLDRLDTAQKTDFTSGERMDAIENMVKRSGLENVGALKNMVFTKDVKEAGSEKEAMAAFAKQANELSQKGVLSIKEENADLSKTYGEASRRIVAGIFDGKLGKLEGKDLQKFQQGVSQRMLAGMQKGQSIQDAFVSAIGNPEELKDTIGESGVQTLQQFINQAKDPTSNLRDKKLNREAFFASSTSVLDEQAKNGKRDAVREMRQLASGKFGKLSEKEAVGRFVELSKSLGLASGDDADIKKITEGDGSGKDKIERILKKVQPNGQRVLGFEATVAAGNANQAALNMASADARKTGLDMKALNLTPGAEDTLSKLDDVTADASMNRVSNALKVGGASYYREAVKQTESQIGSLQKALKAGNIDEKTVTAAFGTGEDAKTAREALTGALKSGGRMDVEYDMKLIETLKGKTIGGQRGMDVLLNEGAMAEAKKAKGADADLVDVAKETNRKDSGSYEILKSIGDLAKVIAPIVQDPSSIFKAPIPVLIQNDEIKVDAF